MLVVWAQYGHAEGEALAATFNTPVKTLHIYATQFSPVGFLRRWFCAWQGPVTLRANLLRCGGGREGLIAALSQEGITAVPTSFSPWGVMLPSGRPPTGIKSTKGSEVPQLLDGVLAEGTGMRCACMGGRAQACGRRRHGVRA